MKTYRWIGKALLAAAVVLSVPSASAAADGPAQISAEDAAKALKFLGEGNKAYKAGKFAEAEAAYKKAFALKRVHDIAGNLGMTEFVQGKLRDAAEHLTIGLRLFPITGEPGLREQMQKTLDQCKRSVATVKVTVNVNGALVYVDGNLVGETPLPDTVYLEQGEHTLEAKADGYKPMSQKLKADKGSTMEATFNLAKLPKPKPQQIIVEVPVKRRSPVPAIAGGAAAVVAVAVGAGLVVAANGKYNNAIKQDSDIFTQGKTCYKNESEPLCVDLNNTAHSVDVYRRISAGAFIGAGVLAIASLTYVLWPSPKPKKTGLDIHAAPVVGRDGGELFISGAF